MNGQPQEKLSVHDGVLYYRRGVAASPVPFVPATLRPLLLTAYHDHLGHPSSQRTASLIRQRYYWPGMDRDVHEHVSACHECTLSAAPSARPRQPVGPTVGHYPFDVLYADILSMTKTHDYDEKTGAGASKLLVFVDSLSRWVEAIPFHKDPTSEQILDVFMEHVVARHGAPRRLISDQGSNLVSRLCDVILSKTGVDLRPSAAEHHETLGTVERFQQTLVGMTRAANEGGRHWVDHLPFLLMSYRATPHRITQLSPAMLLYGRELRLPAQLQDADVTAPTVADSTGATDTLSYAHRLHQQLVYAWRAARDHTRESQGATVSDTVRRAAPPPQFAVGDRVARRLYDHANKLEYTYAGPYRIKAVLGDGRYELTDLENNHTVAEFDVSNLRPYNTPVDAEALASDEYVVDELLKCRTRGGRREYLVKWRGYSRRRATWEPRAELERRCAELIAQFDAATARPRVRHVHPSAPSAADPPSRPAPAVDPASVPSHLPHLARFERGAWLYCRRVTTPRGLSQRWLPSSNFTDSELASEHFSSLRRDAGEVLRADPLTAAAVVAQPATAVTDAAIDRHSAAIWFYRRQRDGSMQMLSFQCSDADSRLGTFGGVMDLRDDRQHHRCALRSLREAAVVPRPWLEPLSVELASSPTGHELVRSSAPDAAPSYTAVWLVEVPSDCAYRSVRPTARGTDQMLPDSLRWRSSPEVLADLESSPHVSSHAVGAALRRLFSHAL